jgi:hypothetical protein
MRGMPEPKERMVRVKRVEIPVIDQLEEATNATLTQMEDAGQEIISVDFHLPATGPQKCSAVIVYNDTAGINEDYGQRHSDYLRGINQRALKKSEQESERRAQRQAEQEGSQDSRA